MSKYNCLFYIIVLNSGIVIYAQEWTAQDSVWLKRILNGTEKIQLNDATRKAIESGALIHNPMEAKQLKASPKEFPIIESFEGITAPESNSKHPSELPPAVYQLQILNPKDSIPVINRHAITFNVPTIRSGGGGGFSAEDILRTIFWPSHRAKKRNAKNANAWKTYNENQ